MSFTDFLKDSSSYTGSAESDNEDVAEVVKPRRLLERPPYVPFYINRLQHSLPAETTRWIKSAADERAAIEHGCRFFEARGQYTVDWIERHCHLYEGDLGGEKIRLEDWQYELYMQGFGWLWFDPEWEAKRAGSGWVRRYRVISGWVPKKNAKSPTLAATGIYCFAGDGELGQKCFSLATTRDQALISHTHALNFVKQSPSLMARCKIDATTGTIFDKETNSYYSILCGDKGTLKKSKEGINGSLFIDETHVVDRGLMGVVSRAGISRRQPLRVQLSTAGEDTAGYGYEQFELGQKNLKAAGESRPFNFRLYHFEYGIPQSTSIDDLRDPGKIESFIKLSNPTIGRIITLGEAKQDWIESCNSDTELIKFAMYRLNQWNTGGGAFIAGSDWERCARPFKISELKEHPCMIGVDLSKISDMTAVVLGFAVPKTFVLPVNKFDESEGFEEREINVPHLIPFFWVPRKTISQYAGSIDIEAMAKAKQLFITDSPIVRIEAIAEHINYLASEFDCRGVACDMYRSRALAGCLSGVHGWDTDEQMFLISQHASTMEPVIEQLQGTILSQNLVHNNNAVLNWQLGNIVVVEDTKHDRRFQKPSKNDKRKIDGWAAILNLFAAMMNDPDMYPGMTLGISVLGGKDGSKN